MEQNNKAQTKIVETYAEDMAKVLEDDKSGMIKKIIHEEEQHEKIKKNISPESQKNKVFMLVGLLLFLLGVMTLAYFMFGRQIPTVPVQQQFTPLIFTDKSVFLEAKDLKKDDIARAVWNEVNATDVKTGGVEGIYLTSLKQVMGLRQLITLLKSSFAPDNNRLFVSDNFLMGVANKETKDFFILIKIRSVADIFDSLRAWENKMFFDIHGFFGVDISADTKYLLTKDFVDGIVQNKNARILYDQDNKIVMMYVFADDNSVIITNSENATNEIILRLASSKVQK